ncbi:MAG: hypothetical protein WC480_03810 [Patescibacteria group bacterium]
MSKRAEKLIMAMLYAIIAFAAFQSREWLWCGLSATALTGIILWFNYGHPWLTRRLANRPKKPTTPLSPFL